MENLVLIDWLSATFKTPLIKSDDKKTQLEYAEQFVSAMGLDLGDFEVADGPNGKNNRLWLDGINIHLPSDNKDYCWLEMSGSGCRAFETYGNGNWNSLLEWCVYNTNIKRLDCAFDDHSGILDMKQLVIDTYFNTIPFFIHSAKLRSLIINTDKNIRTFSTMINTCTLITSTIIKT